MLEIVGGNLNLFAYALNFSLSALEYLNFFLFDFLPLGGQSTSLTNS